MSRAANCGLDESLYPSEFYFNEVATNLASTFVAITLIFYIWNIGCTSFQIKRPAQRQRHERPHLAVNPLSALLAAVVGIVLILATWPQPLEGAALLVVVLAQASVLGWQDQDVAPNHNYRSFWKHLVEKLPDVLAVVVAAYALGDARKKYVELTGNEFYDDHDPNIQMIIAYVLIGTGSVVGVVQEVLIKVQSSSTGNISKICSITFTVIQAAATAFAIRYGETTVAEGCALFNATKICAMLALGLGAVYSFMMTLQVIKRPSRFETASDEHSLANQS